MQNDLQSLFFVLCFEYPHVIKQLLKERFASPEVRLKNCAGGHRRTSRPFFMLARNASKEGYPHA